MSIKKYKNLSIYRVFAHFARKYEFRWLSDKTYLEWMYKGETGRTLNLKNPTRYTEKLQWIKLYDRNPMYTTMVDKAAAKEWASEKIGQEYIIPTYGVWDKFDDIDFNLLPNQFVIKCTHDSKSVQICKDKATFNLEKARVDLEKAIKREYFYEGRQWPYKDIKPKIIVEKYMEDEKTERLNDYKFFTFNGEPKVMYIATGRGTGTTYGDFFDMDFNHLDLTIDHDISPVCPTKPELFEEMKKMAKKLAEGIPEVRVDFYEVNGKLYFGEMTFFHCSGFTSFHPDCWDEKFGSWIQLPK